MLENTKYIILKIPILVTRTYSSNCRKIWNYFFCLSKNNDEKQKKKHEGNCKVFCITSKSKNILRLNQICFKIQDVLWLKMPYEKIFQKHWREGEKTQRELQSLFHYTQKQKYFEIKSNLLQNSKCILWWKMVYGKIFQPLPVKLTLSE